MTHVLVLAMSFLGFAALASGMERHQQEVLGRSLAAVPTRLLRIAGWCALALALMVATRGQGWSSGLVGWFGHLSLGAGMVFGVLAVDSRRRRVSG